MIAVNEPTDSASYQPMKFFRRLVHREAYFMNASEFVSVLAGAAPSIEDYKKVGLSSKEATSFRKSYFCPERKIPLAIAESNELFALMNWWNVGTIEIGMVRLASAPAKMSLGFQVGVVEADPLVIHANDEMAVHEFGTLDHILWPVAKSPNNFLNALAVVAKFISDRGVDKIDFEDFDAAKAVTKQCTTLAGGKRYYDFYSMLLGAEE
jgi:hypothetical protein